MINVRRLANFATQNVNPNMGAKLRVNTGYTVAPGGVQTPSYDQLDIEIQAQSLSSQEKFNLDLINKQGEHISVYAYGAIHAIRRIVQKGSSELLFTPYGESETATWRVEQVMESFPTWCRLLLWRQP